MNRNSIKFENIKKGMLLASDSSDDASISRVLDIDHKTGKIKLEVIVQGSENDPHKKGEVFTLTDNGEGGWIRVFEYRETFDTLSEVKEQLFDAPDDIKLAYNAVVQYFGVLSGVKNALTGVKNNYQKGNLQSKIQGLEDKIKLKEDKIKEIKAEIKDLKSQITALNKQISELS